MFIGFEIDPLCLNASAPVAVKRFATQFVTNELDITERAKEKEAVLRYAMASDRRTAQKINILWDAFAAFCRSQSFPIHILHSLLDKLQDAILHEKGNELTALLL